MEQPTDSDRDSKSKKTDVFDTAHLVPELSKRSVRGGFYVGIAQGARLALQLVSTALLARLLTPEDLGLIGMATVLTGFASMFKDAGLSMATVQREEITQEQAATLFWVNVGLSIFLMIVLICVSPLVAWFYGDGRLLGITVALACTFLFSGLTIQHQALLRRQMRFGILAVFSVATLFCATVAGVLSAYLGAGYWALVIMTATQLSSNMLFVWMSSKWIPGRAHADSGVMSMLKFGGNLTAFSFINYFVRNLDNLLIGYTFGASALGLYANAYKMLLLPIRQINGPITTVAVPALSRLQDDAVGFRSYYCKGIRIITSLGMPIVVFCFVTAEDAVLFLLGPKWSGCVPLFRALAPAAFVGTYNMAAGWIFLPLGQANRQLRVGIVIGACVAVSMVIGLNWGPIGVAAAFSVSAVVLNVPTLAYTVAKSPVGLNDLGRAIMPPAIASLASGAVLTFAPSLGQPIESLLLRLLVAGLVYVTVYAGILAMLSSICPVEGRLTRSLLVDSASVSDEVEK